MVSIMYVQDNSDIDEHGSSSCWIYLNPEG